MLGSSVATNSSAPQQQDGEPGIAASTAGLGALHDIPLNLGPYFFNPSVVVHRGLYLASARTAYMRTIGSRWWWFNAGYVCKSADANFTSPVCSPFDPWGGTFTECLWTGLVDTVGVEDPKLFVWPGKGVFVVLGRKPPLLDPHQQQAARLTAMEHVPLARMHHRRRRRSAAHRALLADSGAPEVYTPTGADMGAASAMGLSNDHGSPLCPREKPWLLQYLVNLLPEPGAGEWTLKEPVPLVTDIRGFYDEQVRDGTVIKEKNWMPLIHKDSLYVIYSISPLHRVLRLQPDGRAQTVLSSSAPALLKPFEQYDIHGGPPVVFVPPNVVAATGSKSSASPAGYYLGVVHFYIWIKEPGRDIKYYHHYAYKMVPEPPFRICAVSREIPLRFTAVHRDTGSGQQPSSGPAASGASGGALPSAGPNSPYRNQRIWKDTSRTAYVSGMFLDYGQSDSNNPKLLLSYGSSDIAARMLTLNMTQLELLFDQPHDCSPAS